MPPSPISTRLLPRVSTTQARTMAAGVATSSRATVRPQSPTTARRSRYEPTTTTARRPRRTPASAWPSSVHRREPPVSTRGTFHQWGSQRNGVHFSETEDEETFGKRLLQRLRHGEGEAHKYDAVFNDEAQDFS